MKRVFLILATVSMLILVFSSSVLAASSTTLMKQHPKPFINQVPCDNSAFLDITGQGGDFCFANNGYIGFRINGAYKIHAGNNDGWVKCYGGPVCGYPNGVQYNFYAYYEYILGGATITQIDIYGQGIISLHKRRT